MPIGAVTGRAEIMDSAHLGGVGSTYGGSPLACVAALEALKMIRRPEFLAHANRLGDVMREVMEEPPACSVHPAQQMMRCLYRDGVIHHTITSLGSGFELKPLKLDCPDAALARATARTSCLRRTSAMLYHKWTGTLR